MDTNITAGLVKELRELTGAGMMECKNALIKANGDLAIAIDELRKTGITKANKKSGRLAAEGVVTIELSPDQKEAVMLEINSETDFVARDANFKNFVETISKLALQAPTQDIDAFLQMTLPNSDKTIEVARQELVAKVGENVKIRRMVKSNHSAQRIGTYLHNNRIGVIVVLDVENQELARDIAMHIAASKPLVIAPENVHPLVIAKEKEIYFAQAASSGKPQEIVEKMVLGKLKKYLDEVSLLGQAFVKDPDIKIANLLNKHRAKVLSFERYEVGEGIEKVTEDFKESVMAQIQGAKS